MQETLTTKDVSSQEELGGTASSNFMLPLCETPQEFYCERCEERIEEKFYRCSQCKVQIFCEGCERVVHGGKGRKGKGHVVVEGRVGGGGGGVIGEVLEGLETVGVKCREIDAKAKWATLIKEVENQYQTVSEMIESKYQETLSSVISLQNIELSIITEAMSKIQVSKHPFGVSKEGEKENINYCNIRSSQILDSGQKQTKTHKNTCLQILETHKISPIDFPKLLEALKPFAILKIKPKDTESEGRGGSLRKSENKLSRNNLSVSRRSFDKSGKKDSIKDAVREGNKENVRRGGASQEVKGCPLKSSVVNGTYFNKYVNSSDKKAAIVRQNSIMTASIDTITPVMLNFDPPSRPSLLPQPSPMPSPSSALCPQPSVSSPCPQDPSNYSSNPLPQEPSPQDPCSQDPMSKNRKKSDYFDLRDRMRKSHVVANRFPRR